MIRLQGGARSACEIGGGPPISALTNRTSIGSNRANLDAGFAAESSRSSGSVSTKYLSCENEARSQRKTRDNKAQKIRKRHDSHARKSRKKSGNARCAQRCQSRRQRGGMMRLTPPQPPGRVDRKARAYAAEIAQLHAQGYTLDVIRQALAAVGITVSISTVWREVTRRSASERKAVTLPAQVDPGAMLPSLPAPAYPTPVASLIAPPTITTSRLGKEVAEAFARTQSTNPLIRAKEQR